MQPKGHTILGISPGTRHLGYAVLKDRELIEWRLKTFRGEWSKEKLQKMLRFIEHEICKYEPNVIALKIPHPKRSSPALNELVKAIQHLAKIYQIEVMLFCIEDLVRLSKDGRQTKKGLIDHLTSNYPSLLNECKKDTNNPKGKYEKVFEAVAAIMVPCS